MHRVVRDRNHIPSGDNPALSQRGTHPLTYNKVTSSTTNIRFILSCLSAVQQRERREIQHHKHRKGACGVHARCPCAAGCKVVHVLGVAFSAPATWLLSAHLLQSLQALQQQLASRFSCTSWWETEAFPLPMGFL